MTKTPIDNAFEGIPKPFSHTPVDSASNPTRDNNLQPALIGTIEQAIQRRSLRKDNRLSAQIYMRLCASSLMTDKYGYAAQFACCAVKRTFTAEVEKRRMQTGCTKLLSTWPHVLARRSVLQKSS